MGSRLVCALICLVFALTAETHDEQYWLVQQQKKVAGLVSKFIGDNYKMYSKGKLTYRMMKQNVADELGISYSDVKSDRELEGAIEDQVDAITKACDGGKKHESCVGKALPAITVREANLRSKKEL